MTDENRDVVAARSAAGHNAYRIIEEYGVETGTLIPRSVTASYLRALAALEGWPAAMDFVRQQQAANFVPMRGHKLELVWSRSADIEKAAS